MELSLVQMLVNIFDSLMVKYLAQHFDHWMGSHLVHMGIGQILTDFCFGPFSIIESSGEDNSTSLDFLLFFLSCCILFTLLLFREEPPESMLFLAFCLCLFRNHLSVRKLNCLLFCLLTLLIFNPSIVLG